MKRCPVDLLRVGKRSVLRWAGRARHRGRLRVPGAGCCRVPSTTHPRAVDRDAGSDGDFVARIPHLNDDPPEHQVEGLPRPSARSSTYIPVRDMTDEWSVSSVGSWRFGTSDSRYFTWGDAGRPEDIAYRTGGVIAS